MITACIMPPREKSSLKRGRVRFIPFGATHLLTGVLGYGRCRFTRPKETSTVSKNLESSPTTRHASRLGLLANPNHRSSICCHRDSGRADCYTPRKPSQQPSTNLIPTRIVARDFLAASVGGYPGSFTVRVSTQSIRRRCEG